MGFKPKRKSQAPQRVGDLLKSFFDVNMPKNIGEEGRVLSLWSRAVGQDISRQTHPVSFRNGILFVETRHPVWTAELSSRRHSIRKKLNEALGKDLIREIHFRQARL